MPKKQLQKQIQKKLDQLQELIDKFDEVRMINSADSET
jgi:restriction endonuclease S subunit